MGDISAEPSMEDILSSIKRIIAEDGDAAQQPRARRVTRTVSTASVPHVDEGDAEPGVLELNEMVSESDPDPDPDPVPLSESIVSQDALASSRGSLNALTRMIGKAEIEPVVPGEGRSMEAFVGDLLRPMLREWLDAHLPELVEAMVAKEIARITRSR